MKEIARNRKTKGRSFGTTEQPITGFHESSRERERSSNNMKFPSETRGTLSDRELWESIYLTSTSLYGNVRY